MLANRLALVTGSASGIGKSIAKLFAKNGASVCLVDMSNDNLNKVANEIREDNKDSKIEISTHLCDVSKIAQVEQLFKNIKETHKIAKTPTVIVNSAGICTDKMILNMSEDEFDKVINVNLKGTFFVIQQAAKHLMEDLKNSNLTKEQMEGIKTYASIINLASVIGKYGNIGQANYAASKAGVEGLTKTTAKEFGQFKIRCNAILPGFIKTPMTDFVPQKFLVPLIKTIPLRRIGQPEDVAQLALFLASDASSYITSASIECGGGMAF